MLTKIIAEKAAKRAEGLTVSDVCLGLGYTAVQLSDGECGACFTFRNELGPKCGVINGAGNLIGLPATELLEMSMSTNLAEASLGVATINAILGRDFTAGSNAIDEMDIRPGDTVGLIGNFVPIVKCLRDKVDKLYVFERQMTDPGLLPDWSEDIYLPECDVVIITGVTFINKTIDHILEMSRNAKEIVLMGPSVCMEPEVLAKYGVTVLAGSRVSDAKKLMLTVAQGGGGLEVSEYMERLCVRLSARRDG